jgi:hypothetical protein
LSTSMGEGGKMRLSTREVLWLTLIGLLYGGSHAHAPAGDVFGLFGFVVGATFGAFLIYLIGRAAVRGMRYMARWM